jgi:hypothetical protein
MGPTTYTDADASDRHATGDTDPYRNAIGNPGGRHPLSLAGGGGIVNTE